MSPRDPGPTGTTTTTQTANKMTSQAGGTQTTPPPSPKKSTSIGGTQTSPSTDNSHQQVGQGQLDHNQDKKGQLTENTSSKGKKKGKKWTSEAPTPSWTIYRTNKQLHVEEFRYWQAHNPVYSMW